MNPLPPGLSIDTATRPADLAEVQAIRFEVFCDEQGVPREIELEHEEESTHYLARYEGHAFATARWRLTPEGHVKIERCAVRAAYRNRKLGSYVVEHLIDHLPAELKRRKVFLHAQIAAERFYQRLGFVSVGEHYQEAGIEHVDMVWRPS